MNVGFKSQNYGNTANYSNLQQQPMAKQNMAINPTNDGDTVSFAGLGSIAKLKNLYKKDERIFDALSDANYNLKHGGSKPAAYYQEGITRLNDQLNRVQVKIEKLSPTVDVD